MRFVFLALLLASCTLKSEESHRFAETICAASAACFPGDFAVDYPNGQQQCVEVGESGYKSLVTSCAGARLDACLADIASAPCHDLTDRRVFPVSCDGC